MSSDNQQVRFVRIHGRVVPIRGGGNRARNGNNYVTAGAGAVGAVGAATAYDAARTRRIYERNGITIDRKKFTIQPFVHDRLGERLIMRDKLGKKMGTASWYKDVDVFSDSNQKTMGSFSWLGIRKKYRGQGHAQTLSRVAAHEMKKAGLDAVWNQVVHPNSATTNLTKHDSFWKAGKKAKGGVEFTQVTKQQALKNINWHRKTRGVMTSDIFRMTNLKKQKTVMPGIRKAFMTGGMKKKLALGVAAAAAGIAGAIWNET